MRWKGMYIPPRVIVDVHVCDLPGVRLHHQELQALNLHLQFGHWRALALMRGSLVVPPGVVSLTPHDEGPL